MKGSRLIDIFQVLKKKERFEIGKALHSPLFNQREDVLQLWELLCNKKNTPSKEEVFTYLYPEKEYDAQQVRAVMSWLMAIIEKTIIFLQQEQEDIKQKIVLSKWYRQRALSKHFNETLDEIHYFQEKKGLKNANFYSENYLIELESYAFGNVNRTQQQNLQSLTDTLDTSFILEKLRQAAIMHSHQAVYKTTYDTGLLNLVLQHIESNVQLLENQSIATYYYCYKALSEPNNESYFQFFKKHILDYHSIFTSEEMRDLYLLSINHITKKLNTGDTSYAPQVLELYKKSLNEGFLLENNIISRFSYRNIVSIAVTVKEYEWAEEFIYAYKNRLERTYQDSMFSFNLARLEYSRKNLDAALRLLQKAEYRDILLALAAKTILLKIYYEQDEIDVLEAHLASMRAYIKRKRVLGYHQTNYKNIIFYTQKLIMLDANKKKISELRALIIKEEVLTEKDWFLAQL